MYRTQASAMNAAEEMRLKSMKNGGVEKTYSYYKCVFCDGYHIGGNVYKKDRK